MSAAIHDEPRTLEEMHARAMAARARMHAASQRLLAKPVPIPVPVPVAPLEPAPPPVVEAPEPTPPRKSRKALLREHAEKIIAAHDGVAAWSGSDLLTVVAFVSGLSLEEIKSNRRSLRVCQPRQVFFWLARQFTSLSYPQIGRVGGGKDHTTVLHAARRVDLVADYFGEPAEDTPAGWTAHLLARPWPYGSDVAVATASLRSERPRLAA